MNSRLLIASGVVGGVLCIFMLAYLANGWGQIRTTGTYTTPLELVEIFKLVFTAGTVVLTLGSMPATRKLLGISSDDESTDEKDNEDIHPRITGDHHKPKRLGHNDDYFDNEKH